MDDLNSSLDLISMKSGDISSCYEFGEKLGCGAYGFVYEATRKKENRKV